MTQHPDPAGLDLRGYLDMLRRRRTMIAVAVVAAILLALVASFLQTPRYRASAEILIETSAPDQLFDARTGQLNDPARDIQNEIEFIESDSVARAVADELDRSADISVAARDDADIIRLTATSDDASVAALTANTYAETAIELRRSRTIADYEASAEVLDAQLGEINEQLAALRADIDVLTRRVIDAPDDDAAAEERTVLEQRAAALEEERSSLQSTRRQFDLARQLVREGSATITARAETPATSFSPQILQNVVLALVAGLVLGLGLAFLRERLDDSVRTKEDVERASGLQSLALVPHVPAGRDAAEERIVSVEDPSSPAAESYRSLRTTLDFLQMDRPLRIIGVTSTQTGEGKSTTCANLAVTLARSGQRVLVVDCDLRRPRLHRFFDRSNQRGFTTALLSERVTDSAIDLPVFGRLALIPSGPIPPDPAELLASDRTAALFARLEPYCDVMVVDLPPVLPVSDALVLSSLVDAMIVVTSVRKTSGRDLRRTVELLGQVGAPVIGTVLNEVPAESAYGYTYGYREASR